jgi:competence ComEA-like helix-hairpin-helix protein
MLSNSEKRVVIFVIFVLLVGSLSGFFKPQGEEKTERSMTFPICINKAPEEELILLPGIGDVLAKRILDYRYRNNGFKSKDAIMKVKGIGKIKFEKIKDKICVGKQDEGKKGTNE